MSRNCQLIYFESKITPEQPSDEGVSDESHEASSATPRPVRDPPDRRYTPYRRHTPNGIFVNYLHIT